MEDSIRREGALCVIGQADRHFGFCIVRRDGWLFEGQRTFHLTGWRLVRWNTGFRERFSGVVVVYGLFAILARRPSGVWLIRHAVFPSSQFTHYFRVQAGAL
jgi:hypothetical protein